MTRFGIPNETTIEGVRLRGSEGLLDVIVRDGIIAAIRPHQGAGSLTPAPRYLLPGLVESHIHLEKAYLLDRMPREAVSLTDAIALTANLKTGFTPADMRSRALRLLRAGLASGVTTFRAHVEVDDVLGLSAIETMLALREEVAGVIELQIVAFPQEGIARQRRGLELLREACALDVDAVGGIPYADDDAVAHLDRVFALAEATGLRLDFHVDLSDDPSRLDIIDIASRTISAGLEGRVTAGHVTALGAASASRIAEVAELLHRADISVVTLPATDVYLNARGAGAPAQRGLTPVVELLDAGVNVAVSTNNVQNAFTPFGRGRLVDTAVLLASLTHMGSASDAHTVVDMMTTRPARAIGIDDGGLTVGADATFGVWPISHERELLGDVDHPSAVYLHGTPVTPEDLP